MPSQLHLTVISADGSTEELSFSQDSVILGSGASANVRLEDDNVSSIHAMLKLEGEGQVRVIDLGSESGTRLRGKEVREEVLSSGDVVELGKSKVRVTFGEHAGATDEAQTTEVVSRPAEIASVDEAPKKAKKAKKAAPPPPPAAALADRPKASGAASSAAKIFSEVIPPEERPTSEAKMLEVVMLWSDTIIGIGHYAPKDGVVTVGDDSKASFKLSSDLIPQSRFPLLTPSGKDWSLTVADGMSLKVRDADGDVAELSRLKDSGKATRSDGGFKGYSYKLGLHDQAIVEVDDTAFVVRYVRPSTRIVTNVWETIDFYFTKVLSTSFTAHALFVAALLLTPIHTDQLSEDLFTNPNRFAKLIIKPPEKEPKKKFEKLSGVDEGKKAKDDEGKFGKKEEVKKEAAPSKKGAPIVDVNKREEDRKKVMKSGLLAALNKSDGASSNVFGPGGLGTGINNALGGLQGAAGMGDAHGVGGLGSRGMGPGGGGTALGIGGLGTRGGGRGRGGYGSIDLGGRGKGQTRIDRSKTIVQGGLAKEVIARIVNRHQNEIKYCYEKELTKDPNLGGKVAIMWIIDATGAVNTASVAQSTMGNANVENCMLQRVRRWKFPQPKGGGIVQVTYPWILKPSG